MVLWRPRPKKQENAWRVCSDGKADKSENVRKLTSGSPKVLKCLHFQTCGPWKCKSPIFRSRRRFTARNDPKRGPKWPPKSTLGAYLFDLVFKVVFRSSLVVLFGGGECYTWVARERKAEASSQCSCCRCGVAALAFAVAVAVAVSVSVSVSVSDSASASVSV